VRDQLGKLNVGYSASDEGAASIKADVLKVEKKSGYVETGSFLDLLPNEYFGMLDEMRGGIVRMTGATRVVFVCDEANLLGKEDELALFGRFVNVFLDHRCQFVVATSDSMVEGFPEIDAAFDRIIHLKGFSRVEDTTEMVEKLRTGLIVQSGKLYKYIHETCSGNPRKILHLLSNCSDFISSRSSKRHADSAESATVLDLEVLRNAAAQMEQQEEEWRRLAARQR